MDDLKKFGGSDEIAGALRACGIGALYPPQELALREGLLSGDDSFVVAAPTASGKTLIGEMAALKVFYEKKGKTLYLVPLRALAREKYEDLSKKYGELRVMMSTGDFDSAEPWLKGSDLIISTNEKIDSLIRHHVPWLKDIALVIADEVHLIGDARRGPTLEVVLARLRFMRPDVRFIALSATIPNAEDIAGWLRGRLVQSDWRPVPLREGVYFNRATIFNDGLVKWTKRTSRSDEVDLALETVEEGGQALIFVNTRRSTEAVAGKAAEGLRLGPEQREALKGLSEDVLGASSEPTRICRKLAECVSRGTAFHHAGINYAQRKLVEDAFRGNTIKIVAATSTLAMGLNLPSRRVVIRDWLRYESGLGMTPLPAMEIKQMSGRAGRPGFDEYGEAVIVAKNKRDEKRLFDRYIKGRPEDVASRLGSEPALRGHILSSIAGLFTTTAEELMEFLGSTFFAAQSGTAFLSPITGDILGFLEAEGMITTDGQLRATGFGRRVSELYIDPASGVILRDALRRACLQGASAAPFALLHMAALTPDMMRLSVRKKDAAEMLDVFNVHASGLLIDEEEKYPSEKMLSELKTASALMQWILEMHEDKIVGHFGIGPGDLRTLVDIADWLLYSASEIARVLGLKEPIKPLSVLRARVAYGVKEELFELVSLKGIGRVRARNLFGAGIKTLSDVDGASIKELSDVPAVGRAIAESIKKQVPAAE